MSTAKYKTANRALKDRTAIYVDDSDNVLFVPSLRMWEVKRAM